MKNTKDKKGFRFMSFSSTPFETMRSQAHASSVSTSELASQPSSQLISPSSLISSISTPFKEEAVKRISNLLTQPDDLYCRVPLLLKKFMGEKASIESQLKSGLQSQLDELQSSLQSIFSSKESVSRVKENLKKIDALCMEASRLIDNYAYIKQVSLTHQNVIETRKVYDRFSELNHELERLSLLLDEDKSSSDSSGYRSDHLLLIHYYLFKLEEFRSKILSQLKNASSDVTAILQRYFKRLESLGLSFDDYFWTLCSQLLASIRNADKSLMVKIVRIIEAEEMEDAIATAQWQQPSSTTAISATGNGDAKTSRHAPSRAYSRAHSYINASVRQIKSYRHRFFSMLHASVRKKFVAVLKDESEPSEILSLLDFYVDDLLFIQSEIAPCFPSKYHIVDVFVMDYHQNIYETIHSRILLQSPSAQRPDKERERSMSEKEKEKAFEKERMLERERKAHPPMLTVSEILALIGWMKRYYTTMTDRLDVPVEMLEPRLLDDREIELTRQYVSMSKTKVSEWLSNLYDAEERAFTARQGAPDLDSNGKYTTPAANDLFQILRGAIESASSASHGRLLADLTRELARCVLDFQRKLMRLLESESQAALDKPETANPGLEDYTIMMGNAALKWIELTEGLALKIEADIQPAYKKETMEALKHTSEGFVCLARLCNSILVESIFATIRSFTLKFFTDAWYKEKLMNTIIATFDDFFRDYQGPAAEYLFSKLVGDVLERFLILYLTAMKGRHAKFRVTSSRDLLKADRQLLGRFFSEYREPSLVETSLDVLERIGPLITSAKNMVFLDFFSLYKHYPDVPLDYIEDILSRRDDMDRSSLKSLMETCRAKTREDKNQMNSTATTAASTATATTSGTVAATNIITAATTTIFSRLKI